MKFIYGKQSFQTVAQAQENGWLLTNGLGGFSAATAAFSVNRSDQALLMAARNAPNDRICLVQRLSERLDGTFLSTQEFSDGRPPEDGFSRISTFVWEYGPRWEYAVNGIHVTRQIAMGCGQNTVAVVYKLENRRPQPCTFTVEPVFVFAPKGAVRKQPQSMTWSRRKLTAGDLSLHLKTDAVLKKHRVQWEALSYSRDTQDGREDRGLGARCCELSVTVPGGESREFSILFSDRPVRTTGKALLAAQRRRLKKEENRGRFRDPVARQLSLASADFLAERPSCSGKTILAGFPFFGDWGRDTMIALPGCVLARKEYTAAKSILRTFLACEQDGLVPNLFPEGSQAPMYNTVDAALLLINCIWLYHTQHPDAAFVREAWPVLKRIVAAYCRGTRHGIRMDSDGLIQAGQGMDQVTWMDVCVDGILPTPRHGKPVEINAYWYNALRILEHLAPIAGESGEMYAALADQTAASFRKAFWLEEGYLKDVISGTAADTQIRCNQIWAVTMPFTMLTQAQEKAVVDTVYRHLYTPCGLRTLSPDDPQFCPHYGGPQKQRDLAYHQGTVWPFPLGAYYLAYLKVNGHSKKAKETVSRELEALADALREGCIGQLPEIYDGLTPGPSQGCFAQAWSVGELLRVYEVLEKGNAI